MLLFIACFFLTIGGIWTLFFSLVLSIDFFVERYKRKHTKPEISRKIVWK